MKKQLTVIFIIFTMLDPSSFATEITGEGGGDLQITVSDFKNAWDIHSPPMGA